MLKGVLRDALKWREHQKALDDAELAKTAKIVCRVYLDGGDVLEKVITASSKVAYSFNINPRCRQPKEKYIRTASSIVDEKYRYLCRAANSDGLHIDGSFYPASQIKRIERGEIEVTTDEV